MASRQLSRSDQDPRQSQAKGGQACLSRQAEKLCWQRGSIPVEVQAILTGVELVR